MADFENAKFTNEAVNLDGNTYESCTFTDCELIIGASAPFIFAENNVSGCRWTLTGAAAMNMNILTELYQQGPEMQQLVEQTFESVRGRGDEGVTVH